MKTESKDKKKSIASLSTFTGLGISVLVHLVIFLFVGSIVIFEGKVPAVPFLGEMQEPAGGLDMEDEMPLLEEESIVMETSIPESELTPTSENMSTASATSTIDVITSATTSPAFAMPTGVSGPSIDTQSLTGNMRGSMKGKGPGLGKGVTANLFGRSVQASRLGVVLDVSGSAHAHLIKAIEEIDDSFPSANMIMVVGCGMFEAGVNASEKGGGGIVPGKPRIVAYTARDSEDKYDGLERSAPAQLEKFFKRIGKEKSEDIRKYFKKRDNLYILYGGDIYASHFAFDYLLDLNADVIYWFADFADRIEKKVIEDLTKDLRRNNTKVIAHNFTGNPVKPEIKEMAEATGGSTIELIPGK